VRTERKSEMGPYSDRLTKQEVGVYVLGYRAKKGCRGRNVTCLRLGLFPDGDKRNDYVILITEVTLVAVPHPPTC
jgi:hypothetical protein